MLNRLTSVGLGHRDRLLGKTQAPNAHPSVAGMPLAQRLTALVAVYIEIAALCLLIYRLYGSFTHPRFRIHRFWGD